MGSEFKLLMTSWGCTGSNPDMSYLPLYHGERGMPAARQLVRHQEGCRHSCMCHPRCAAGHAGTDACWAASWDAKAYSSWTGCRAPPSSNYSTTSRHQPGGGLQLEHVLAGCGGRDAGERQHGEGQAQGQRGQRSKWKGKRSGTACVEKYGAAGADGRLVDG